MKSQPMLQRGDQVPDFDVVKIDGLRVRYVDLWQRKNLIFVCTDSTPSDAERYARRITDAVRELNDTDASEIVVTPDIVPRIGCPGVVIADRWGEVHFATRPPTAADLPKPGDLADWLHYVQMRCPECEGETR